MVMGRVVAWWYVYMCGDEAIRGGGLVYLLFVLRKVWEERVRPKLEALLVWANHGGWSSLVARWSTSSAFILFIYLFLWAQIFLWFRNVSGFCLEFF